MREISLYLTPPPTTTPQRMMSLPSSPLLPPLPMMTTTQVTTRTCQTKTLTKSGVGVRANLSPSLSVLYLFVSLPLSLSLSSLPSISWRGEPSGSLTLHLETSTPRGCCRLASQTSSSLPPRRRWALARRWNAIQPGHSAVVRPASEQSGHAGRRNRTRTAVPLHHA